MRFSPYHLFRIENKILQYICVSNATKKYYNMYSWLNKQFRIFYLQRRNTIFVRGRLSKCTDVMRNTIYSHSNSKCALLGVEYRIQQYILKLAFSVSFVWLLFNIKWEVFQYSCQRILDKYTLGKTDRAIKNEQWTQTTYGTIHRTKTSKTKHRKLYIRYLSWIVRVLAHWKNSHLFCRTISFLVSP